MCKVHGNFIRTLWEGLIFKLTVEASTFCRSGYLTNGENLKCEAPVLSNTWIRGSLRTLPGVFVELCLKEQSIGCHLSKSGSWRRHSSSLRAASSESLEREREGESTPESHLSAVSGR